MAHLNEELLQIIQEHEARSQQLQQEIQQGSRMALEEHLRDITRTVLQRVYGTVSEALVDQYTAKLIEEGILS